MGEIWGCEERRREVWGRCGGRYESVGVFVNVGKCVGVRGEVRRDMGRGEGKCVEVWGE